MNVPESMWTQFLEKIMDFFSMFDWTYLISGFISILIISQYLYALQNCMYIELLSFFMQHYFLFFMVVYVIGMFTFLIGKYARRCIFHWINEAINGFSRWVRHFFCHNKMRSDKQKWYKRSISYYAIQILNQARKDVGPKVDEENYQEEYSRYWSQLRNNGTKSDMSKYRFYVYCNRLYTRQSIYEGIIGSMVLLLLSIFIQTISYTSFRYWYLLLLLIPVVIALLAAQEAKMIAENQIRDVINSTIDKKEKKENKENSK